MADKMHLGVNGSTPRKTSWIDGLPHKFNGWGPQTPDPDADDESVLMPDNQLTWRGEEDTHNHYVWHFDGRRRRHHHH